MTKLCSSNGDKGPASQKYISDYFPSSNPKPIDAKLWRRFKYFTLIIAYFIGRKKIISKVNLVKGLLFAYLKGVSMYVPKNLGKAGVVPRDVLRAIDELIDERLLVREKSYRIRTVSTPFGGIRRFRTEIDQFTVPLQVDIREIYSKLGLDIPFERMEEYVDRILFSSDTNIEGRISIDCILKRIEKEIDLLNHRFHRYVTYWDVDQEWRLVGTDQIKFGEVFAMPFPKVILTTKDPIKRNARLVKELLRRKNNLQPQIFWIKSAKRHFQRSKESTIGTLCLFSGFINRSLKYDSTSKTYVTTLTESVYYNDFDNQISLILDANEESAFYFTNPKEWCNYEFAAVGALTEYESQVALRCYGLIEIDTLPTNLIELWKRINY